jgi:hypothetical protein
MKRNDLVKSANKKGELISVHLGNNIMETLFKQENIDIQDIHKFFMDKLNYWNNIKTTPTPEKTCFDKYYYWLDYPICWFRSLAFMFMMDETHRKMLLEHNKDKTYTEHVRLNQYIMALMTYIETGIYNNSFQEPGTNIKHSLYWIYYNFSNTEQRLSMDDFLLWLLHCMSEANVNFVNINKIRGFNALFYVKNMYYNNKIAALAVPSAYHHCLKNENLTISLDEKSTAGPASVSRILVKYFFLSFTNAKNARLALFVRRNNRVYTLSSLTITSYIQTWSSLMVGHQFCIYKCNRKFYHEDSEIMHNLNEVQLLSDMLLDIGLVYTPDNYYFYANKSNRAALYTPSLFIFSEEECNLLKDMSRALKNKTEPGSSSCLGIGRGAKVGVQGCNHTLQILSCLAYFTKSLTVIDDKEKTWKFWNELKYDDVKREFMMIFYAQNTAIVTICESSIYANPTDIKTSWLAGATTQTALFPQGIREITAMTPCNVMQIDALRHIFSMANMYVFPPSPSQQGGAQRTHIMINNMPNKKYKVCIDKSSKRKYITSSKRRVFLSEIKGKYKYVR